MVVQQQIKSKFRCEGTQLLLVGLGSTGVVLIIRYCAYTRETYVYGNCSIGTRECCIDTGN